MNIQESIRHIKKLHYKKIFNKYFIPYFPLYNTNHVKQLYIETPQVLPVQQNLQSVTLTSLYTKFYLIQEWFTQLMHANHKPHPFEICNL